jgi:hypothetical protein
MYLHTDNRWLSSSNILIISLNIIKNNRKSTSNICYQRNCKRLNFLQCAFKNTSIAWPSQLGLVMTNIRKNKINVRNSNPIRFLSTLVPQIDTLPLPQDNVILMKSWLCFILSSSFEFIFLFFHLLLLQSYHYSWVFILGINPESCMIIHFRMKENDREWVTSIYQSFHLQLYLISTLPSIPIHLIEICSRSGMYLHNKIILDSDKTLE